MKCYFIINANFTITNFTFFDIINQKKKQLMQCIAPSNSQIRKNLEALLIDIMKPSLNEQTNFDHLIRFRNGIT